NLDQVEPLLLRDRQRLRRRHDAELLAGVVDDPDFPHADALVDPHAVVAARASVECDNGLLNYFVRGAPPPRTCHGSLNSLAAIIATLLNLSVGPTPRTCHGSLTRSPRSFCNPSSRAAAAFSLSLRIDFVPRARDKRVDRA